MPALFQPPPADGIHREFSSIVTGSYTNKALVSTRVVDAIGDTYALSVRRKIMVKDFYAVTAPSASVFWEGSNELAFFGINADNGQTPSGVVLPLPFDIAELSIPVLRIKRRL